MHTSLPLLLSIPLKQTILTASIPEHSLCKGVDIIPCKIYQPLVTDDSEELLGYNIVKYGLDKLYRAAGDDPTFRVLGGVAFVHLGATYSCAPEEISRNGEVPKGVLIDLKFKLVSFHCLYNTTEKIKMIAYKTGGPKQEY